MNLERDKFLIEQLGECWHEWEQQIPGRNRFTCKICQAITMSHNFKLGHMIKADYPENIDLSTWQGFGKLKELLDKKELLFDLIEWNLENIDPMFHKIAIIELFTKEKFASTVYEFLKNNNN